jgi:hypothetical protein
MKKLIYLIIAFININAQVLGKEDIYITVNGNSYSEARVTASRLASSQGMKIVGQNYTVDHNRKWHVIFQLRSRY